MQLSKRDRTLTLVGVVLAMFLGALDQTIVATALPRIVEDLQGLSRYAWVATAYLLASTVLVPIYGKLADLYSRKRIELFALSTFLLGSVLCGVAGLFGTLPLLGDGMTQLIIFRAVQGIGGAGLFSMAFIVIADLYSARERGKSQGYIGAAFGVASVLGPWVGGLLTDYAGGLVPGIAGWRWVFLVNVPLGAVALWFVATRMPPLRPTVTGTRLDVLSAALLILALVPFVLALQLDKAIHPWSGGVTLALFAGSALFAGLFVWRSLTSQSPVLDLRLFRNRVFTMANVAGFLLGGAFLATIIFLPLFMVNVLGVSATGAGLSLIPLSLGTSIGAIASGQLASRLGRYKPIMLVAVATLLIAMWLLSRMGVDTPYWQVTLFMLVVGMGVGPGLPLYTLAIQNAVDPRAIGQATSASQFFRQIGGAVAVALMGTLLAGSLAPSFAQISAASTLSLDATAYAGEGRPAGAAAIGADVRRAFAERAEELTGAPREQMLEQGELVAGRAEEAVRRAFAAAITDVFGALFWVVLAGAVATLFVPSLVLAGRAAGPEGAPAGVGNPP